MGLSTWALKPDSLDTYPRPGFNVISPKLHTAHRLRTLHCWAGSYSLFRMQLGSGSKSCGGKVVFKSGSKDPCGEPHCISFVETTKIQKGRDQLCWPSCHQIWRASYCISGFFFFLLSPANSFVHQCCLTYADWNHPFLEVFVSKHATTISQITPNAPSMHNRRNGLQAWRGQR